MPVSKKRKKKGKPVERGEDRMTGLTLQDMINVVAAQEAKEHKEVTTCDLPGCYGQLDECAYKIKEQE